MIPRVSVIVPTMALRSRAALLRRAVRSILDQSGVDAVPLVMVNGVDRDPGVLRELRSDPRVRVHVLETAGLAKALQVGRRLVDGPWFAALDDDDVLLPGALAVRVDALLAGDEYDCVVTNGYRRREGVDTLHVADMGAVARDPVGAFWRRNWLLPGSYLCRTDRVSLALFDGMPDYLECSFVALRLATSYRVRFLARPTVVWFQHGAERRSTSRAYVAAQPKAHEGLLMLDLPPSARRTVIRRITIATHAVSVMHLRDGEWFDAWRWHLRSLARRGGLQYLLYTRKLFRALLPARSGLS